MSTSTEQHGSPRSGKAVHPQLTAVFVRLSDWQHESLTADAKASGKSVPDLLRSAYFSGPRKAPLFAAAEAKEILAALGRIGNNVNQIARQLNGGLRFGFDRAVEGLTDEFGALSDFLRANVAEKLNAT